jgi:UDP-glucose 4-epimerase
MKKKYLQYTMQQDAIDVNELIDEKSLEEAVKDVDYIFHIAAFSNIDKMVSNPLKAIKINILGTINVLEAARQSNVKRILFASSYFVDSGKGHLYTTTKTTGEMLCKDYYHLYKIPYTILRYGTAYGPRSRGEDVISIAVNKALSKKPFIIYGKGDQSRNFIYVEDLADGNVAALKNLTTNKTYILEGEQQVTINEIVRVVKNLIGDLKIEYKDPRPEDFTAKPPSDKKARDNLSWEPKIDLTEGVKRYISWYNQQL